jgi:hypothetical protein
MKNVIHFLGAHRSEEGGGQMHGLSNYSQPHHFSFCPRQVHAPCILWIPARYAVEAGREEIIGHEGAPIWTHPHLFHSIGDGVLRDQVVVHHVPCKGDLKEDLLMCLGLALPPIRVLVYISVRFAQCVA